MKNAILVLNAGSSSIKFALFEQAADSIAQLPLFSGQIDGIGAQDRSPRFRACAGRDQPMTDQTLDEAPADIAGQHRHALDCLLGWLDAHDEAIETIAIGHRVVHGGDRYIAPTRLNPQILTELERYTPLAPLHQPHNLDAIRAITSLLPDVPQFACFDTAFHHTQPDLARQFALPQHISRQGVKRYGFHGISYEYIANQLPPELAQGRVIVAHLGNGASLCALHQGRSIATTMGFSSLDGLVMGTRCGAIDPGVLLYLLNQPDMDTDKLGQLLYRESGLLGVSGLSQDMRSLLAVASSQPAAQNAIDLFCYRIVREIGSLTAALGGLNGLIYTGGIGEHAAPVRGQINAALGWLGADIDMQRNLTLAEGGDISTPQARIRTLVIPTNEEWMIARHCNQQLAGG